MKKLIIFIQLIMLIYITGRDPYRDSDIAAGFSVEAVLLQYSLGQRPSVYNYNNHIYFVTTQGVFYFYGHEQTWYHMHYTEEPILSGAGTYIAVWQAGDTAASVFGSSGYIFTVNVGRPILNFTVNCRGYSAMVVEYDDIYYIYVLDPDGRELFHTVISDSNIFPLGAALGENILAISLMDTNNPNITGHVLFFDIYRGAIGAVNMGYGIISTVKFVDDLLFVVLPTKLMVIDEGLNIAWEKYGDIQDAFFDSSVIALLTYSGISFLDHSGYLLGYYDLQNSVSYFGGALGHVIIGSGRQFTALDAHGTPIWEFISIPEPLELHFLDSTQRILLKTPIEGQILETASAAPTS